MATQHFHTLLLSGSPGTGKTHIARELEQNFGFRVYSLGDIVLKNHLFSEEDKERDTKVADLNRLNDFIHQELNKLPENVQKIVLESHYADAIDHSSIKLAIVLRCHPELLEKRLKERQYSQSKILENVQAELVGDCGSYMLEKLDFMPNLKIFELDTSNETAKKIAAEIAKIFEDPSRFDHFAIGWVSWLSDPSVDLTKYT
jgi:adenylate kinase